MQCNCKIMGVTKSDLFTKSQNDLSIAAKAFSHPARVAIIEHLLDTRTCINGDLVDVLGLAQATISQHLRELKDIGIIQGNIDGVKVNYCLDPKKWNEIKRKFDSLFAHKNSPCSDDCC